MIFVAFCDTNSPEFCYVSPGIATRTGAAIDERLLIFAAAYKLAGGGSTYQFGREPGQIRAQDAMTIMMAVSWKEM
jgi:hypothetical protein